ncbi:MAG: archease [Ardenticatenaceae bacterium]|nr:archease [Ardenticatenaceae bacterium]
MAKEPFVIIDHTADWALQVYGRTLADLFIHAAQGMASLMVANPDAIAQDDTLFVELEAYDTESLLVDWLTELAYWAETEQMVGQTFEITSISPTRLGATVHGGKADELQKHIKAVTFHNLEIIETEDGLEVAIVFDV